MDEQVMTPVSGTSITDDQRWCGNHSSIKRQEEQEIKKSWYQTNGQHDQWKAASNNDQSIYINGRMMGI
jgi:hypothetical protein